jgi:hypothetical protein
VHTPPALTCVRSHKWLQLFPNGGGGNESIHSTTSAPWLKIVYCKWIAGCAEFDLMAGCPAHIRQRVCALTIIAIFHSAIWLWGRVGGDECILWLFFLSTTIKCRSNSSNTNVVETHNTMYEWPTYCVLFKP